MEKTSVFSLCIQEIFKLFRKYCEKGCLNTKSLPEVPLKHARELAEESNLVFEHEPTGSHYQVRHKILALYPNNFIGTIKLPQIHGSHKENPKIKGQYLKQFCKHLKFLIVNEVIKLEKN